MHFPTALRLKPDYPEAHNNLGVALLQRPQRLADAILRFETALRLRPNYADAHYNLGLALANSARPAEALTHLETAERLRPDPQLKRTIDQLRLMRR